MVYQGDSLSEIHAYGLIQDIYYLYQQYPLDKFLKGIFEYSELNVSTSYLEFAESEALKNKVSSLLNFLQETLKEVS